MKHMAMIFLSALCFSATVRAAPPACAAACDSHSQLCTKHCTSQPNTAQCKNSCSTQHEDCLNGCSKKASANLAEPQARFGAKNNDTAGRGSQR